MQELALPQLQLSFLLQLFWGTSCLQWEFVCLQCELFSLLAMGKCVWAPRQTASSKLSTVSQTAPTASKRSLRQKKSLHQLLLSIFQANFRHRRNSVSRALFRKRELTEFLGRLGELCQKNLSEFALAHKS